MAQRKGCAGSPLRFLTRSGEASFGAGVAAGEPAPHAPEAPTSTSEAVVIKVD